MRRLTPDAPPKVDDDPPVTEDTPTPSPDITLGTPATPVTLWPKVVFPPGDKPQLEELPANTQEPDTVKEAAPVEQVDPPQVQKVPATEETVVPEEEPVQKDTEEPVVQDPEEPAPKEDTEEPVFDEPEDPDDTVWVKPDDIPTITPKNNPELPVITPDSPTREAGPPAEQAAYAFPAHAALASITGVQGLAWVSGRFLLAAAGPGIASAMSFAPSALATLGLWGASGASSALGAQYMIQGFQLIATGGMLAPPGPYMQNYKDITDTTTWALDPQAIAGRQPPSQSPGGGGAEPCHNRPWPRRRQWTGTM